MSEYRFIGNPEEETSVSIDGVRLADIGVHVLAPSQEPMVPILRNQVLTVPERHGSYDFGAYLGERNLDIACGFNNQASLGDSQRLIRDLTRLLFDNYGRPKTVEVIYDYEPDIFYMARLSSTVPLERIVRAGKFTLPMIAYDPFAYSAVASDELTWGSEVISFEYQYLLGHDELGRHAINENTDIDLYVGGLAVSPIIEISGSANRMTITNGVYRITLPSFKDSNWTIDCEKYTVTKNGKNEFGLVDLREFYLLPGNNKVEFRGTGIDVELLIKYRDKFV